MVKNLPAMQETLLGKIHWRKECLLSPVFLPRESHRQKSLAGSSPWCHKESDITQWLNPHHTFLSIPFSFLHFYFFLLEFLEDSSFHNVLQSAKKKNDKAKQNKYLQSIKKHLVILTNEYDFFLHNHKIYIFGSTNNLLVKVTKTVKINNKSYSFYFSLQLHQETQISINFHSFYFFFNFIFKLYIIVLVLPNIKMNPPQVYMCSPS